MKSCRPFAKKSFSLAAALAVLGILQGCSNGNKDLTRERAKEVLASALNDSAYQVKYLQLTETGLEKAKNEGLVDFGRFPKHWFLTDQGYQKFGSFITGGPHLHDGSGPPLLTLKQPVRQSVEEVTGITDGTNSKTKTVEFTTKLVLDSASSAAPYAVSGNRGSAVFQLYDDGWRVTKIE